MGSWRERWRERRIQRGLDARLGISALEARIKTFGPHGRGIVSGLDLTPYGVNETAKLLFQQGEREEALTLWRALAEAGDMGGAANMAIECAADGHVGGAGVVAAGARSGRGHTGPRSRSHAALNRSGPGGGGMVAYDSRTPGGRP